jgi:hypothetical protein
MMRALNRRAGRLAHRIASHRIARLADALRLS